MKHLLPLGILLAASLGAQDRAPIVVQNLAPMPRQEWVRAVVPFAQGEVRKAPELQVAGKPTVWAPLGARWADGSWRQGLCWFRHGMQGLSEDRLEVRPGESQRKAIQLSTSGFSRPASLRCRAETNAGRSEAPLQFVRWLEDNEAVRTGLFRARLGRTGLVCEVLVECYRGQAHQRISCGLFHSDPQSKTMQIEVRHCSLRAAQGRIWLRHPRRLGMQTSPGRDEIGLLSSLVLGDGQGIRRLGIWAPPAQDLDEAAEQSVQAAALTPILAATSWRRSGAYGPFGVVPELPPWLSGGRLRGNLARRHAAFVASGRRPGHPLQHGPFGLARNPAQTGGQRDFGILKLQPVVATGIPSFLHELELSLQQEACRPVHFFEADGSPVQAVRHPDWLVWSGKTHWNCKASRDRLGKPCPPPRFETHGWRGKDRQHWSSNHLCGAYLCSGEPWIRREIENEVQLFLAMQRTEAGVATSGSGAPRAVGRMLLAGCWMYLCTGNPQLFARLRARVHRVYLPQWAGRDLPTGTVRPIAVRSADPRILGGRHAYWSPWEESLAATGLAAYYRLSGDPAAGEMARVISQMVLRHGWRVGRGAASIGYAIRWQDRGRPLPESSYREPGRGDLKYAGGGIAMWSLPAVQIARFFALRDDDQVLLDKSARVLAALRRAPRRPGNRAWVDELSDWDAVR